MQSENKKPNESGYLMLNGPDDTLWIPRSSNKSWLTLFYLLPKELVQKQKEYLALPRCPYDVLRTDKYDELIENDVFLQLVWGCYAWMIFQRIPIPKKDGTYIFIPGLDLHYSGNFPLWRMSYYLIANNVNPYEYIKYLLEKMPEHLDEEGNVTDPDCLKDMMPWSDAFREYEIECIENRRILYSGMFPEPLAPRPPKKVASIAPNDPGQDSA